MKNSILFIALMVVFVSSCGPAAEDREAMYKRAKVFQDSIANQIKTSMDAAAAPVPGGQVIPGLVTTTQTAQNPTAQATPTPGK